MPYDLLFKESAAKEWKKLDGDTKQQFAKKLKERLENPRVQHDALHGMKDCYKIKLRTKGYRLVYKVEDEIVTVRVIAVGRRDGGEVYDEAEKRQ
ncbi:type II toxin-antitoxin system RelE/ParE family toxin [Paraburkholderia sp. BL10I2N1]|uniref:type II toxin-antitoxin system RelE family toxin n=1 Tax=Paraburkholderia sp. BL10I2N1 TaxID=1938796 RepID=UPI00105E170C|nr:type II toxin-antitoxin system RelE/ParE family toxin [Paraburkholderia sp. BL10I2N1]TDN67333.1 mRNA interferase RelE/StbE [Paraburkholderia sp. BL10I2N1]